MKKSIYLVSLCLVGWSCSNLAVEDSGDYDVRAVEVLDSLSDQIGVLKSVSYTLNTIITEKNQEGELVEFTAEHDVYMRGPNKMHINTQGSRGNKGYWYNGNRFAFYSYTNNEYDTMAAPDNILKLIDGMHAKYNVDFPAADFFYSTFTDDIINNNDKLIYWGKTKVEDATLYTISAYNKEHTIQIWVDVQSKLPARFVMFKKGGDERYQATFSNWKLNPQLPDVLFEFLPSADAVKIDLQPKK